MKRKTASKPDGEVKRQPGRPKRSPDLNKVRIDATVDKNVRDEFDFYVCRISPPSTRSATLQKIMAEWIKTQERAMRRSEKATHSKAGLPTHE